MIDIIGPDPKTEELLNQLRALGDKANPAEYGERFLLPWEYQDSPQRELKRMFGDGFSPALLKAKQGEWDGPIASGYGQHLVFVQAVTPGRIPRLEEVRDSVKREWFAERRLTSKDEFYNGLRSRYEVVIQRPGVSNDGGNEPTDATP